MEFKVKICDVVIKVRHKYAYMRLLCREYLADIDATCDFEVSTSEEAIAAEKQNAAGEYTEEVCEATCLHREIVKGLVQYGVVLMHAAVVAVDGCGYVFMAKSGVGKSTHIGLWKEVFGQRAVVVNGDKPFFSFDGDTLMAHGSPWKGKEGWGETMSVPVCGICFLEQGSDNHIRTMSESEVIGRIFHQVLIPREKEKLETFMAIMGRIMRTIPFYQLRCNMDKEAALVAYEIMRREYAYENQSGLCAEHSK